FCACEVGHEATGEGIPCPGGIEHVLQRIGRHIEGPTRLDEERAVLAPLDDHPPGPMPEDPAPGPMDVPIATQLTRLAVVHHEDIDPGKQLEQGRLLSLDPVVHGVADHQLGARHLLQYAKLEIGIDVSQEDELCRPKGGWETRLEVSEHPQSS